MAVFLRIKADLEVNADRFSQRSRFPRLWLLLQTDLLNFNLDLLKSDMRCNFIHTPPPRSVTAEAKLPSSSSGVWGPKLLRGLQDPSGKISSAQCSWSVGCCMTRSLWKLVTKAGADRRCEGTGQYTTAPQPSRENICRQTLGCSRILEASEFTLGLWG